MKRRVYIALTIAVIVVGLSLFAKYKTNNDKNAVATLAVATSTDNSWLDSTEERAKLEAILKTSIQSTSSDAIKTGTNPQIIPTTATDRLAQELFTKYVEISKAGIAIDSDISAKLAESLLAQDYSEPEKLYTAESIKIQSNTSAVSIKKYANDLGTIIFAPPSSYENELVIFQKLVNEPVDRYIDELNSQKARYTEMRLKLLALPAPQAVRRNQADIINALTLFISAIDGAISMDTDPVGAVTKIGSYDNGLTLLENATNSYRTYLRSQNITFSSSEKGLLLVK